jgi:UDP-glucose 4-epimerase
MSPYGTSKLMSELMLKDIASAHDLNYVILRYFNVAGADPQGRSGQCTPEATHLIKVACETALGKRVKIDVFGTDYPTQDGTCIRDYIQVSDLIAAHVQGLDYLRGGGESELMNCGYGTGYSVLDVLDSVKKVSGVDFTRHLAPRRAGDPAAIVAKADKIRKILGWQPKYADLDTIVAQALNWERKISTRQAA